MPAPSHPLPPNGAVDPAVARSLRQASAATQVDFSYLLATATQESGLQPDARSARGSATGLFQFIDSTWLQMVQRFGAKYGIGELASKVSVDNAGRAHVSDPATRRQILDLRRDPRLSAAFAAEYAKSNKAEVEEALGRPVGNTDLYMAHFLGAGGATEFLKAVQENGSAIAAKLLPEAAAANRGVFYDASTGAPRTVADIYHSFARKLADMTQDAAGASAGEAGATPSFSATGFRGLLGRLGLGGTILTDPMRALLDSFAASALRLLGGNPDKSWSAPIAPPPPAPTTAPSRPAARRHSESQSI